MCLLLHEGARYRAGSGCDEGDPARLREQGVLLVSQYIIQNVVTHVHTFS